MDEANNASGTWVFKVIIFVEIVVKRWFQYVFETPPVIGLQRIILHWWSIIIARTEASKCALLLALRTEYSSRSITIISAYFSGHRDITGYYVVSLCSGRLE
jgi:hypothetical protein